jgi:hypothetical protein
VDYSELQTKAKEEFESIIHRDEEILTNALDLVSGDESKVKDVYMGLRVEKLGGPVYQYEPDDSIDEEEKEANPEKGASSLLYSLLSVVALAAFFQMLNYVGLIPWVESKYLSYTYEGQWENKPTKLMIRSDNTFVLMEGWSFSPNLVYKGSVEFAKDGSNIIADGVCVDEDGFQSAIKFTFKYIEDDTLLFKHSGTPTKLVRRFDSTKDPEKGWW